MKVIFQSIILLFVAVTCYAQVQDQTKNSSNCALTVAQAPAIRGIHLQMGAEELLALFPGSANDPDIKSKLNNAGQAPFYGIAELGFYTGKYATKTQFAGINQFDIQLFDNRVTRVYVSYDSPTWNHVDEMATRVSETLGLPSVENWTPVSSTERKMLQCLGFSVEVYAIKQDNACCSSIDLRMQGVEEKVRERKNTNVEKSRREFKP